MTFYNMEGEPLSLEEFAALFEGDQLQRVVEQTTLPGGVWISTVLLGLDHQFGDGPPLIFETMVFESSDYGPDLDMDRYSTREQAEEGHRRMVTKWTGWTPGDDYPEEVGS